MKILPYWFVRKAFRKLSLFFDMQCSGKQKVGHAVEWCQHRAFHDGACINYAGEEFIKNT